MTTIKDIASLAGVSVGSVSRYLNGYQLKEANSFRIKQAIKQLNYIPNQTAKALKMNRSFSIGILVDNMDNFYSSQLLAKLEKIFDKAGYFLLLTSHRNSAKIFEYKLHKLIERSVDALIILKAKSNWTSMQKLEQLHVPVVVVETSLENTNIPEILTADKTAAQKVIKQMLLKRKKTAFVIPSESDYVLEQRIAGIKGAFSALQMPFLSENIINVNYGSGDAYDAVPSLIRRDFDALFVVNYTNIVQVIQSIRDFGQKVGSDIAVAGFGYSNFLQNMKLPATLIKQPVDKVAENVANTVLRLLRHEEVERRIYIQDKIFWQKELRDE